MTPAAEIFHVATGYLSSDDLGTESMFALKLFNDLKNLEPESQAQRVASSHRERLAENNLKEVPQGGQLAELMSMVNQPMDGSHNRRNRSNSRNGIPGTEMFQQMIARQFRDDQQFSIDHPLLTFQQLERNPAQLVGNGTSFFASSSSGN